MQLDELRNKHEGETIWVLGSGPSLNFVHASVFFDESVVATNFSARAIGLRPQYAFTHYHANAANLVPDTDVVVTLGGDTLTQKPWQGEQPATLALAPQKSYAPPGAGWNPFGPHTPPQGSLAYGSSSLHGAMHLAAFLGASKIILVGADCGQIDGADRVNTYPVKDGHTLWQLYDKHHKLMADWLRQEYGISVMSLNPFINFNLEGHRFTGV